MLRMFITEVFDTVLHIKFNFNSLFSMFLDFDTQNKGL